MDIYDVFISFKNKDVSGNDTLDQKLAFSLYRELTNLGVSTFFSNSTLINLGESAFKEAINEALDSSSMLVVVGTSTDHITSPWVRYEWSSFHDDILSGRKEKAAILSYISGMSPSLLPRELRNYEALVWEEKTPSEAAEFIKNYLGRIRGNGEFGDPSLATNTTATTFPQNPFDGTYSCNETSFSPVEPDAINRLKKLSQLTEQRENEILDRVFELLDRPEAVVLDYGCARGATSFSRFAQRKNVSKIICVDINAKIIEEAKQRKRSDKMSFYCISDTGNCIEELHEIMRAEKIDGFDLIFIASVLQHVKRPGPLIRILRQLLKEGGCLYSRAPEDATKIAYPDENEIVKQIISRSENCFCTSDRHAGMKQYALFRKAGLQDLEVHSLPQDTDDLDYFGKIDLFEAHFGWRITDFEKLYRDNPSNPDYANDYRWMKSALYVLEDMFADDSFWYGYSDFACFGFTK